MPSPSVEGSDLPSTSIPIDNDVGTCLLVVHATFTAKKPIAAIYSLPARGVVGNNDRGRYGSFAEIAGLFIPNFINPMVCYLHGNLPFSCYTRQLIINK